MLLVLALKLWLLLNVIPNMSKYSKTLVKHFFFFFKYFFHSIFQQLEVNIQLVVTFEWSTGSITSLKHF